MTHSVNWKGLYYDSVENCTIITSEQEIVIKSIITGNHDAVNHQTKYQIVTTAEWRVKSLEITYTIKGVTHQVYAMHDTDGWIVNGNMRPEFKNCIDVDITLTPFTNTLPIKRLDLSVNQPKQIEVFYIDVLENSIRPARQQYTKKSGSVYNFQNVPNDFEADIIIDNAGFVVHYPKLFDRI